MCIGEKIIKNIQNIASSPGNNANAIFILSSLFLLILVAQYLTIFVAVLLIIAQIIFMLHLIIHKRDTDSDKEILPQYHKRSPYLIIIILQFFIAFRLNELHKDQFYLMFTLAIIRFYKFIYLFTIKKNLQK